MPRQRSWKGWPALVDQSLLRVEEPFVHGTAEARFAMLETIREYALERLEASGESEVIQQAHAAFYLVFAERAEPELTGPAQAEWLTRLGVEHDNLRAALAWSLGGGREHDRLAPGRGAGPVLAHARPPAGGSVLAGAGAGAE